MKKIKSLLAVLLFSSVVNGQEFSERGKKALESVQVELLPNIGISVGQVVNGTEFFKGIVYGTDISLIEANFSDKLSIGGGFSLGRIKYNKEYSSSGRIGLYTFYGSVGYKPIPKMKISVNAGLSSLGERNLYFEPKITYRRLLWDVLDVYVSYKTLGYSFYSMGVGDEKANIGVVNIGVAISRW